MKISLVHVFYRLAAHMDFHMSRQCKQCFLSDSNFFSFSFQKVFISLKIGAFLQ